MNTASCVGIAPIIEPAVGATAGLDRLGDEIAELSAHLDAATARLLDLIREFDARGGWNTGFCSCAAWLTWRVGLDRGAARERVRVARAGDPATAGAGARARRALILESSGADPRRDAGERRATARVGRAGTAEHVERIVRGWRRMDRRAEAQETTRRHRIRALYVYQDEDGMVVLRGRLEPEVGAVLIQALTAAREALYQKARAQNVPAETSGAGRFGEPPTMPQQQADALALVAETALHHGIDPGAPASATRSWSTSTRRCWRTLTRPVNRSSTTARAFPRRRPSVWRVTRVGSSCDTIRMAGSSKSVRGLGPFRLRCGERCSIAIAAAASQAAGDGSARAITSTIGRTAAPLSFRTWHSCVAGTTAPFTKRASRWSDSPTES